MLAGSIVALVTPMLRSGEVDWAALDRLIDWHVESGTHGIVPVGTTGESATLSVEEHIKVVERTVVRVGKQIPVIAGTGANSTSEAIELTRKSAAVGADACLLVTPYYNRPTQEGLYQHYKAIASETGLPLMLYSVPGRSSIEIGVETTVRLAADCPNIVAIKEAGGSVERVNQLVNALPSSFGVLSGDDPLTLPFMVCGAIGLVSVASNIIPSIMSELVNLCLAGDFTAAAALHKKTYPLMKGIMSLDVNPVPIKAAAALMGHCSDEFRLPLVGLTPANTTALSALLKEHGLI